jgi:hypothetical protein
MPGKSPPLIFLLSVFALLGSCAHKTLVFDETLPPGQTARIHFSPGIEVLSYNGIVIVQKKSRDDKKYYRSGWHDITVPSGRSEFEIDIRRPAPYTAAYYRIFNAVFAYDFEAGKEYTVRFNTSDTAMAGIVGRYVLLIYDRYPPKGPQFSFREPAGGDLDGYLIYRTPLNAFTGPWGNAD